MHRKVAAKLPRVGSVRHRRRHSRKLLAAGIVVVVLAALAGSSVFAYSNVKARGDQLQASITASLQSAQAELEAGKSSLEQANTKHDATLAADAATHFGAAKSQFTTAAQIADSSSLLQW